jgi:methylmalonyl-CoA carboxyltransferase 12S subunit
MGDGMKDKQQTAELVGLIEALRADIARLEARITHLETGQPMWRTATAMPAAPMTTDGIDQDIVMSIAAAVATYLGVKPRIRQIRLLGSAAWAQQGRVTIQASYAVSNLNR